MFGVRARSVHEPDAAACLECVPGKHKIEWTNSVECTVCAAGKYSEETGATNLLTCADCPSDTTSRDGSSVCTCNIGYSGPDGGPCEVIIEPPTPVCGGTVVTVSCSGSCSCAGASTDSLSGIIASAPSTNDYARLYPYNANCGWIITANSVITFKFSRFELHNDWDWVNIFRCQTYAWNCPEQIAHLTGYDVPPLEYTSNTGYLKVQLSNDDAINKKGFVATWSAACITDCRPGLTGPGSGWCWSCASGTFKILSGSALCSHNMHRLLGRDVFLDTRSFGM